VQQVDKEIKSVQEKTTNAVKSVQAPAVNVDEIVEAVERKHSEKLAKSTVQGSSEL